MLVLCIVKSREDLDAHVNFAPHTFYSPYEPLLQIGALGNASCVIACDDVCMIFGIPTLVVWSREEVHDVHYALFLQVACLENIAHGQILLLGCAGIVASWTYCKVAALFFVQDPAENGW